jgi:hypothetical protein
MYKFSIDDQPGLDEFENEKTTTPARASSGRFPKGNKEGNRFPKGGPGKPRGAKNRKTLIAREFALDVLYLDPETGRQMTYPQLCTWIKRKADTSPRILNLLLDHALGKPPEHIQQEQVVFILKAPYDNAAQDAEVVDGDQKSLLEGEK